MYLRTVRSGPPASRSTSTSASSKPIAIAVKPRADGGRSGPQGPGRGNVPQAETLARPRCEPETPGDHDRDILDASTWGPVLAVGALFDQLGLWSILDKALGKAKGVPFTDRAFVLVANRLIHPASEHGLAGGLETDFVCDRQGRRFVPHWHPHQRVRVDFRQLEASYRTLDQLVAAQERIEVALYHRLRDLFSFKPDLVLDDITSTYFEGAGPANFAQHGYSRDGELRPTSR